MGGGYYEDKADKIFTLIMLGLPEIWLGVWKKMHMSKTITIAFGIHLAICLEFYAFFFWHFLPLLTEGAKFSNKNTLITTQMQLGICGSFILGDMEMHQKMLRSSEPKSQIASRFYKSLNFTILNK